MDTFAQVTIPLIILLALRIKTRKALLLLPLTMVIDLDIFFGYYHRLLFHNIFVAFLLPLMIVVWVYNYKPKRLDYALIGFFYVFSSLIFDLADGIALFYPLTTDFYFFQAALYFGFIGPIPVPDLNINMGIWAAEQTATIGEGLGAGEIVSRYPSMSETSTGLMFTLLVAAIMYFRKSRVFLEEAWGLMIDILKWIRELPSKLSKR
ncbi:MAG: hypothetical protein ACQESD_00645 [Thermoplasmatota archaeon]